jgi:hypothetical protein
MVRMARATEEGQATVAATWADRLARVPTLQSFSYSVYRFLWAGVICTGISFGIDRKSVV